MIGVHIVGAGMAGLLAARLLRHLNPIVYEAQPRLPNNHHAVLRFRTGIIGALTNIPFRRVNLIKGIEPWVSPVADSMAYSYKNTGMRRSDRSITTGLVEAERFIAPPDFISRLAEGVNIKYNTTIMMHPGDQRPIGAPTISTIPMPELMRHLGYEPRQKFSMSDGCTITARIKDCDAYVSVLVPDPEQPFSRVSITGDRLIIECPRTNPERIMQGVFGKSANIAEAAALRLFGLPAGQIYDVKTPVYSQYAKILPLEDDDERKQFMFWATDSQDIYSLGRFATWRPGLLLDDLVKDINLIAGWIVSKDKYQLAKVRR